MVHVVTAEQRLSVDGVGRSLQGGTLFYTKFSKKLLALHDPLNKFDKHADFEVNFLETKPNMFSTFVSD